MGFGHAQPPPPAQVAEPLTAPNPHRNRTESASGEDARARGSHWNAVEHEPCGQTQKNGLLFSLSDLDFLKISILLN